MSQAAVEAAVGAIAAALRVARPGCVQLASGHLLSAYQELYRLWSAPSDAGGLAHDDPFWSSDDLISALHLGLRQRDSERAARKISVTILKQAVVEANGGALTPRWELFFALMDAFEEATPHLLMDAWLKVPPLFDALLPLGLSEALKDDGVALRTADRLKRQHLGCNSDITLPSSSATTTARESLLASLASPAFLPSPFRPDIPFEWASVLLERIFTHDNLTVRRALLHRFLLADVEYNNGTKAHFLDGSAFSAGDRASKEDEEEQAALAAVLKNNEKDEDAVDGGNRRNNEVAQLPCPFALRLPPWWVCGEQHLFRCVSEASMFKGAEDQLGRALQRFLRKYHQTLLDACMKASGGADDIHVAALLPVLFTRNAILSLPSAIDGKTSPRRIVRGLLQATEALSEDAAITAAPVLVPPVLAALRLTVNSFSQKQHRGATALFQKEALALVFNLLPVSRGGISLSTVAFMVANLPASAAMPTTLASFASSASSASASACWLPEEEEKGKSGSGGPVTPLSLHPAISAWLSDNAKEVHSELAEGLKAYLAPSSAAESVVASSFPHHHEIPWTAISLARLLILFPWKQFGEKQGGTSSLFEATLAPLMETLATLPSSAPSLSPRSARAVLLLHALLATLRCEERSADAHLSASFAAGSFSGPLAPALQQSVNDPAQATNIHEAALGPVAFDDTLPPLSATESASAISGGSGGGIRAGGRKVTSSNDTRIVPLGSEFLFASARDIEGYSRAKAASSSSPHRLADPVRLKTQREIADECGPLAAPPIGDPYLDDDCEEEEAEGNGSLMHSFLSPSALPESDPSLSKPFPLTVLPSGTSAGVAADLDDPRLAGDFGNGNFYTAILKRKATGPEAVEEWTRRFIAANQSNGARAWDPKSNPGGPIATSNAPSSDTRAVRDDVGTAGREFLSAAREAAMQPSSSPLPSSELRWVQTAFASLLFPSAGSASPAKAVFALVKALIDSFANKLDSSSDAVSSFSFDHLATGSQEGESLSPSGLSPVPLFSLNFYLETTRLLVETAAATSPASRQLASDAVVRVVSGAIDRLSSPVDSSASGASASKQAHAQLLRQAHALQVLALGLSLHPSSTSSGLFASLAEGGVEKEAAELRGCIELVLSQCNFKKPSGADLALPFSWRDEGAHDGATSSLSWPHFRAFFEGCKWVVLSRALYRLSVLSAARLDLALASSQATSALCGLKADTANLLAESAIDSLDSASSEAQPAVISVLALAMRFAVAREEDRDAGYSQSGEETIEEITGRSSSSSSSGGSIKVEPITSVSIEGCAKALISLFFAQSRFNRPLVQAIGRCFFQPYLFLRRPGLHASVEVCRSLAAARGCSAVGDAAAAATGAGKSRVPILRRIVAVLIEGSAHDGRFSASLQLFTARLVASLHILLGFSTSQDLKALSSPSSGTSAALTAAALASSAVLISYSPVLIALALHREPLHDHEEPMSAEEPAKTLLAEWHAAMKSGDPTVREEAYRIAMIGRKKAEDENREGHVDILEEAGDDGADYWNSSCPSAASDDPRPEAQHNSKKAIAHRLASLHHHQGSSSSASSSSFFNSTSALALRGMGALTRVQVLCFFESICDQAAHIRLAGLINGKEASSTAAVALHRVLLLRLLLFTTNPRLSYDWIPGGPTHCAKIRLWQALTLLMSRWGQAKQCAGLPLPSKADEAALPVPSSPSHFYLPASDMVVRVSSTSTAAGKGGDDEHDQEDGEEEDDEEQESELSPFPLATLQNLDPAVLNALSLMDPPLLHKLFGKGRVWSNLSPQRALELAMEASPRLRARVAAADKLATKSSAPSAAAPATAGGKGGKKDKKAGIGKDKSAAALSRTANLAARAPSQEHSSYLVASSFGSVSRVMPRSADPSDESINHALDVVAMRKMIDSVTDEEDEGEEVDGAEGKEGANRDEDALVGEKGVALKLVRDFCSADDNDHTIAALCVNIVVATSMLPGQHSSTRFYVDSSVGALGRRFPQLLAGALVVPALAEPNLQPSFAISVASVGASMMQALIAATSSSSSSLSSVAPTPAVTEARFALARRLFSNAVPWLVSNNGVMRSLVQTLLLDSAPVLFPELFDSVTGNPVTKLLPLSSGSPETKALAKKQRKTSWFLPTLRMLLGSADLQAMHARQRRNAAALLGSSQVTLLSLLCDTKGNEHGELLPVEPLRELQTTFAFVSSLGHAINQHNAKDSDDFDDYSLWTSSAGLLPGELLVRDSRLRYGLIKRSRELVAAQHASPVPDSANASVENSAPLVAPLVSDAPAISSSSSSSSAPANVREQHYTSTSLPVLNNHARVHTTGASKSARTPGAVVNMQRKIGSALEESYGGVAGGATGGAGAAPSGSTAPLDALLEASTSSSSSTNELFAAEGGDAESHKEARRAAIVAELQRRAGVHPLLSHQAPGSTSRRCQPVIICASLLDKATNLGGLARTAEIFGLEALCVPDMKVTEEQAFKDVSVSAGEWMTLAEVPPSKLIPYLRLKRTEGYTICGLEQAARSRPLGAFAFPRKLVIVLGAELLGMPTEVLQELDLVVEIPQLGQIRSLNVHVSASLLVWQYTSQFLSSSSSSSSLATLSTAK